MNERDKTAQMMHDSSGQPWGTEAHFQRFADLIRADEREACAMVCETKGAIKYAGLTIGEQCAAAIRTRSDK